MSPFGLKFSQTILHTETIKLMYNWCFAQAKFCTSQHSYPVPLIEENVLSGETKAYIL